MSMTRLRAQQHEAGVRAVQLHRDLLRSSSPAAGEIRPRRLDSFLDRLPSECVKLDRNRQDSGRAQGGHLSIWDSRGKTELYDGWRVRQVDVSRPSTGPRPKLVLRQTPRRPDLGEHGRPPRRVGESARSSARISSRCDSGSSAKPLVGEEAARSPHRWSGHGRAGAVSKRAASKGARAKASRQRTASTRCRPPTSPDGRRCSTTAAAAPGQRGTISPPSVLKQTTTEPPGRRTRAISATAGGASNQWKASAQKTPSTEASESGISSAGPASVSASRIRARSASSGSTATTRAKCLDEKPREFPGTGREIENRGVGRKLRPPRRRDRASRASHARSPRLPRRNSVPAGRSCERAEGREAVGPVEEMAEEERDADVAGEERVAAGPTTARRRSTFPIACMRRRGRGRADVVAGAAVEDQERIGVAGGAATEARSP